MMTNVVPVVCLGVAALTAGGCVIDAHGARAEATFSRTLSVSGPVDLDVQTGSGDIQVRTGEAGAIQVRGRVRAGFDLWNTMNPEKRARQVADDPPIEQSGNTVRLGSRGAWTTNGVSISYEVIVPADAQVRTRTGSGDQTVDGVRRGVDSSAGSGDIRIERASGEIHVSAGSGDVEVDSSDGSLVARTGSGSIRATRLRGDVSAHTGSGRVTVTESAMGRAEVSTGSGDINVSGVRGAVRLHAGSGDVTVDGEPAAPWIVEASSGSVSLRVPQTAAFDLDAHTSSGGIRSDHPITQVGTVSRRELRGQVRGGGPRVEISTASGSIRLQ